MRPERSILVASSPPEGIDHHFYRLDRRMLTELVHATRLEGVDPGIAPDVRSGASIRSQAEGVDVRALSALVDEHEFVLDSVKATLTCVGLHPDADVFVLAVDFQTGVEKLFRVPPIHTNVVDGPIRTVTGAMPEGCFQEASEFDGVKVPSGASKFSMSGLPPPAGMTLHRHIVGRIEKAGGGDSAGHKLFKCPRVSRVIDPQAMPTKLPGVA